jgi:acetyltransferase-like isoleucine patch superfamily enzyme
MPRTARIEHGQYTDVDYLQWRSPRWITIARAVAGALTWPLVWPLAMLCRVSDRVLPPDMIFRTISELLSLIPYVLGVITRAEFYRFALTHFGRNVVIEFGTVFIYRDISIGDNANISRYCVIHHCDIGNYAGVSEHSVVVSGSRQHNIDRTDIPIFLQGGRKKRIAIGDDCWIGAHSVVMEDVGRGAIVGAGAVVTKPVPEFMIAVGNPARPLRRRGTPAATAATVDAR